MTGELAGQVALVTGGGRGVGRAIALTLAGAGATVGVVARSADQVGETVRAIEQAGGRAHGFPADVTDWEAAQRIVEEMTRLAGSVDLLVNNAGVSTDGEVFWETDPAEWWRIVEINMRGVMLYTRAVLPGMVARRRARIVNVGSNSAIRPNPLASAYASSKAAVLRFTDSIAAEAREHGVQVFAISPGLVRTAMTEKWQRLERDDAAQAATGVRPRPPGAWLPPERAAELCLFLSSGRGDALAGHFIHAGDDWEELARNAERIATEGLYILRLPKLDGLAR